MTLLVYPRGDVTGVPVVSASLWANPDDRLSPDPLGRIERRNGIAKGRDVADDRPQTSVPHPLDNRTQLGAIGHDDEVDRRPRAAPSAGRRRSSVSFRPGSALRIASPMSPPMTSNTRSTPPTSFSAFELASTANPGRKPEARHRAGRSPRCQTRPRN